ncbi:MAG TPA: ATP-binding protein [Candidatus Kapabacteria bacterium]|nr:ATP-binding protein [Candidatus Kapabacteria bacterium]
MENTEDPKTSGSTVSINSKHLAEQLNWYKSLFENASDAVFIIQPETWCVLEVNESAADLLGLKREELLGTSIQQFRRIFKLLKKSNSPVVLSELLLDTKDGQLMVEVSAKFINIFGEDFIYVIARDVSEQRALTEKLVQADKFVLLGQITAGITHELRNPLAAINLNLQILQRNIGPDSTLYKYIETALQGVDRISKIIEVTLNFSHQSAPNMTLTNLNSIIQTSLDLLVSLLKRKDIKIEMNLEEALPEIEIDNKQIQQVLINLITNAADAIDGKGKITIETKRQQASQPNENDYVSLSISDTGKGIPPEDLQKIFNPFFTRKANGTGLGLPITQRIIYQHHGSIDVQSIVGKGTQFNIKFPIPKDNEN